MVIYFILQKNLVNSKRFISKKWLIQINQPVPTPTMTIVHKLLIQITV